MYSTMALEAASTGCARCIRESTIRNINDMLRGCCLDDVVISRLAFVVQGICNSPAAWAKHVMSGAENVLEALEALDEDAVTS